MTRATVRRHDPAAAFDTPERCAIVETSNSDDDPDLSIADARVAPGVTTRWHRLRDTVERYVILEGTGTVEIGESLREPVRAGDVCIVPPLVRQRIANTGPGDLRLLAICTPRYRDDNYEDCDDTSGDGDFTPSRAAR